MFIFVIFMILRGCGSGCFVHLVYPNEILPATMPPHSSTSLYGLNIIATGHQPQVSHQLRSMPNPRFLNPMEYIQTAIRVATAFIIQKDIINLIESHPELLLPQGCVEFGYSPSLSLSTLPRSPHLQGGLF